MAKREYESGTIEETYMRRENARNVSGFTNSSGSGNENKDYGNEWD